MKLETVQDIFNVAMERDTAGYCVTWYIYKDTIKSYEAAAEKIEKIFNDGLITYDEAVQMAIDLYNKPAKIYTFIGD